MLILIKLKRKLTRLKFRLNSFNLIIYRTYYKQEQKELCYEKNIPDFVKIVNTNESYSNSNLNVFWSEYIFIKYVWESEEKTRYVGFDQYRKKINTRELSFTIDLKNPFFLWTPISLESSIYENYCQNHLKNDIDYLLETLNELYGNDNKYCEYLLNSNILYAGSCFILKWKYFDELCSFIFGVLDKMDHKYGFDYDCKKYENYYKKQTILSDSDSYDAYLYQRRAFGYLAERLLSAFFATHFNKDEVQFA